MKTQTSIEVEKILQVQRDKILEVAERHGARNVRVFGSVVRGEAIAESDIDLLVDLGETLSAWFPMGLIHELEALLNRKVDVVTEKTLHPLIRDRVLQEAKPL
ncbi:nucleotidyltransferase family protein [Leptolyngbya sp. AN03gr2]|uniref:nucleotidyltransferase family protein n=1 Tax=unclassified Leptolyngbya TaxID=2650499 RepID=UPI003D322199